MSYERTPPRQPLRIPLPLLARPVGLGDVVAGATGAVGIPPCGGCGRRRNWLNERVQLIPRRRNP